jgi:hypothetical protein
VRNATATSTPDDDRRVVLFARLPERLDDEQRRRKYDQPLTTMIRQAGIGAFLQGFSQTGDDGAVEWIGLEVEVAVLQDCGFVAAHLVQLGAPPDTVVEIDTANASTQFSLTEMTGR